MININAIYFNYMKVIANMIVTLFSTNELHWISSILRRHI
jgi:hypothetical protein